MNLNHSLKASFKLAMLLFLTHTSAPTFGQDGMQKQVESLRSAGIIFKPVNLFAVQKTISYQQLSELSISPEVLSSLVVLDIEPEANNELLSKRPSFISLQIHQESGNPWLIDLFEFDFRDGELIIHSDTRTITPENTPMLYRGSIRGFDNSFAAITITAGEVRGLISVHSETYTIGKTPSGVHILYQIDHFNPGTDFSCEALETEESIKDKDYQFVSAPKSLRCVKVKAEIEKNLIDWIGGPQNAIDYAIGLFNEVTTLYANDDITLVLAELLLWENGSPYSGTALTYIQQMTNNSPNANLTTMLSRSNFGGVAYLTAVCSSNFGVSYNGVYGSYSNVPTYSWDAMVVAHELGHNLSSPHTHACSWNGNNTALDGCGPQAGYSEGCTASLPTNGGTIMSYCHLIGGVGINFNNGFGVQPANRIRNYVNNASCLSTTCTGIGGGEPEPEVCTPLNFSNFAINTYAPSLSTGTSQVQNSGSTLFLQNNSGRSINLGYTVTPNTILQFEFSSTAQAQLHGVGFNSSNSLVPSRIFKVYGTLNNPQTINNFSAYSGSAYVAFSIPVGSFYTGTSLGQLFFVSGNVAGAPSGNSYFRNVRVFESGQCSTAATFGESPVFELASEAATGIFSLYPNPANYSTELYATGFDGTLQLRVFDLSGKVVLTQNTAATRTTMELDELKPGIYVIEARTDTRTAFREKLLIAR